MTWCGGAKDSGHGAGVAAAGLPRCRRKPEVTHGSPFRDKRRKCSQRRQKRVEQKPCVHPTNTGLTGG